MKGKNWKGKDKGLSGKIDRERGKIQGKIVRKKERGKKKRMGKGERRKRREFGGGKLPFGKGSGQDTSQSNR